MPCLFWQIAHSCIWPTVCQCGQWAPAHFETDSSTTTVSCSRVHARYVDVLRAAHQIYSSIPWRMQFQAQSRCSSRVCTFAGEECGDGVAVRLKWQHEPLSFVCVYLPSFQCEKSPLCIRKCERCIGCVMNLQFKYRNAARTSRRPALTTARCLTRNQI